MNLSSSLAQVLRKYNKFFGCVGSKVGDNNISGALPKEIGLLSSLMVLYDPSLCFFWEETSQLKQAPLVVAAMKELGRGAGERSTLCMCWQGLPPEQHLRLAAY